ncbi:hypothetical protein tb265_50100 [Gemmatimonadetes bacterium T265]|nr:hypothetical protein tb265_50100 [Gemmatimonadetes bacterium T265]
MARGRKHGRAGDLPRRVAGDGRGFTLVELLVAVTIGALALAAAHAVLAQLVDGTAAVVRAAAAADRAANADRLLRDAVGQLEVRPVTGPDVDGTETTFRFSTWCDVPAGWQERCTARLAIDAVAGRPALVLSLRTDAGSGPSGGAGEDTPVVLRTGFADGRLRYLSDPASGGRWAAAWSSRVTAPFALGVILDADTLIVRIGTRG